ncbi:hypothetical protein FIBSPDRAFT_853071 [Athelia psychrophila]|uniref:Uncharacterized protein n=1 Tax=Athelia psychrophila TaxID=1759441 RepID=A0A166R4D0_9AGAM|nr:hypothetical protein FIBSPDRAFT_853071 [Fibularhizoctonia sp. CBS 109695]
MACTAITKDSRGRTKPAEGSVKVFDMNNSKIKGTTAANIQEFEQSLFGSDGWLSPLKVFHLLCAAGSVLHYKEENGGTVKKAGDKFKFFQGETNGKALKEQEGKLLLSLKADAAGEEEMCISKLELTLARQEWGTSKQEPTQ